MTWRICTERAQHVRVLSTHVSASTKLPYDRIRINHRLLMLIKKLTELNKAVLQWRCYSLTNKKGK